MIFLSKIISSISNAKKAKIPYIIWHIDKKERITNILSVLTILRNNGIIRAFSYMPSNKFVIYLKYDQIGNNVIRSIFNVSKPSRILYVSNKSLWQPQTTTGFFVLSTTYGIITDIDARRYNVGGCILFGVT